MIKLSVSSSSPSYCRLIRLVFVSVVFMILTSTATNANENTNLLVNDDSDDKPRLIKIDEFAITYGPTSSTPSIDEDKLQSFIEKMIESYVQTNTIGLEYLLLTNIQSIVYNNGNNRRHLQTTSTTTIDFKGGIASYELNSPIYTTNELNQLIKDSTQQQSQFFIDSFNTNFNDNIAFVEYIDYNDDEVISTTSQPTATATSTTQVTPQPTDAPTKSPLSITGENRDVDTTSNTSPKKFNWIVIVGGITAVTLVAIGFAVIAVKVKQAKQPQPVEKIGEPIEIDDAETDIENATDDGQEQSTNAESEAAQYQTARDESIESMSVTSNWTIEDSLLATANTAQRAKNDVWMASEACNRDRQVTLQKDMLYTMWSRIGIPNDLKQQLQQHSNKRSPSSCRRGPFVFEQAYASDANDHSTTSRNEEEIYFMPGDSCNTSRPCGEGSI